LGEAPLPPSELETHALSRYVERLDRGELVALALGLAPDHEPVRRAVQTAAVRAGEPAVDFRELIERVNETLRVGFVATGARSTLPSRSSSYSTSCSPPSRRRARSGRVSPGSGPRARRLRDPADAPGAA
jgi:hypothetical protein